VTLRRDEAGFSIVLAVFAILILITIGIAMVSMVVEDSDLSVVPVRVKKEFYAAHAGVVYAIVKLQANWAWGGLSSPGKNVGRGSFWVAPPDMVDENGNALPAGRKRIVSNGVVGNTLRQIQVQVAQGGITTYAGTGVAGNSGDGGSALSATLSAPGGVTVAPNGDIYIADVNNHSIRKVAAATGVITTFAGNGSSGFSGDGGPATAAGLKNPQDIYATGTDLYIADAGHNRIRKVSFATGIITTVAGSGPAGSTGDGGAATSARIDTPEGVAVTSGGDIYIADKGNNKIRKVNALTGIITTYAGTGTAGYSGDGGLALLARLTGPYGLDLASNGDLYIADTGNSVVRRVSALTGIITTYAGTGTAGFTGDGGAATSARLNLPQSIRLDASGNIYIADTANNRIRYVTAAGVISTIAGTGTAGSSGDGGSPTSAQLNAPDGVTVTSTGAYYISDSANNKIRKVNGNFAVVAWVETRT